MTYRLAIKAGEGWRLGEYEYETFNSALEARQFISPPNAPIIKMSKTNTVMTIYFSAGQHGQILDDLERAGTPTRG